MSLSRGNMRGNHGSGAEGVIRVGSDRLSRGNVRGNHVRGAERRGTPREPEKAAKSKSLRCVVS
jgi:hypothetical protein